MAAMLEEPTVVQDEVEHFTNNFVSEMKKIENVVRPPLYHDKPGVRTTPVEKRSPYWQPVDEES